MKHSYCGGHRAFGVVGVCFIILCAATAALAQQQAETETKPGQRNGYTVRKADDKFVNAVDDFARYRDKKEWEKAFRSLTNVLNVDPKLMAPSKDGFMLPARQRIQELLVTLPPEGREAYRLFNDAPAKQLYDQAVAAGKNAPAEEVPLLRKVVDQYFVASIGDQAADRLGDSLFEGGDFLGAEALWATIAEKYPDPDLDTTKLQVKRGVAMARGKRWEALQGLIAQIKEKNAGASVTIGGKDVVATDYLASLVEPTTKPTTLAASAGQGAGTMTLPGDDKPIWQCSFLDNDVLQKIAERINNWGWQGMMGNLTQFIPSSDTDGKRVYVNWLGACFAVDAATGKLLWRTDKFEDITQRIDQLVQSMPDVNAYASLAIPGDRVLFVRVPVKRINYDEPVRLTCHDANTGTQKWSSENGTLSSYEFIGKPVMIDEQLIAPAKNRQGSDLMLLTIDPMNGKMLSSITVGQAAAGQSWRGNTIVPSPQIQAYQGKLYVLTNNGGVVCINPATKSLEWAFQCEGSPPVNQNDWWNYRYSQQKAKTPGVMIIRDGTLYFKERGIDDMYALDLTGASPSLKWKRPVDDSDMLAGVTNDRLVMLGYDAGAIDLKDRKLQWSTRVPLESGMVNPVLSGDSMFVFVGRGVYEIDSRNGKLVKIFRGADRDSMGGALWQAGQKIVTVSNQAVTAYPAGTPAARAN